MNAGTALPRRRLGRTGLELPVLGLGGAPLGDLYARLDEGTAQDTVAAAVAAGLTFLDTAPLYGHGLSEHRIGAGLRRAGDPSVVLSTKVGRVLEPSAGGHDREGYAGGLPFAARFDYSGDGALRSLEDSLRRLGRARIDVALIHDIDRRTHGAGFEARYAEAMTGAYPALARLRDAAVVGAIGIGVNEAEVAARFLAEADLDAVMLAGRYTLLEQGALDALLPLAEARGAGVLLAGIYNSGILATGARAGATYDYRAADPAILDRVARIERVCAAHGTALPDAALAFALAHPAVTVAVLGAVSPAEVRRNRASFDAAIPAGLWSDLRAEGLLRSDAPVPA